MAAIAAWAPGAAFAAEDHLAPKDIDFSFQGPFGTFDPAALQRGFHVYNEVCAICHSMDLMHFRNLAEAGGPGFTEQQVKAIAAQKQVSEIDKDGNVVQVPAKPSDTFPAPYPNEAAARASNAGALPPDLSVLAKAREGGAEYIYSILTGFDEKPPADFHVREGLYYNPYFPGRQIAMPPPLNEGAVEFTDGTKATVQQMAHDVAAFLMWAAEPKMDIRKRTGFGVVIYLLIFTGLIYFAYRKVWADKH